VYFLNGKTGKEREGGRERERDIYIKREREKVDFWVKLCWN
jgi:hypothetical protein